MEIISRWFSRSSALSPCTRCTLVDRDDPIAEMVAKKIIEVGATVRDPEEVCKLAVEQLGRPN